eukprot:gene1027-2015_t
MLLLRPIFLLLSMLGYSRRVIGFFYPSAVKCSTRTAHTTPSIVELRKTLYKVKAAINGRSVPAVETKSIPSTEEIYSGFNRLGLLPALVEAVSSQGFNVPTAVQNAVIPRLIGGENLVMAASTGSGKTLAYMLPAIQSLLVQEMNGYTRTTRRPRCLVLVPTRELARQVLTVVKSLSHFAKISSSAVLGGEEYGLQKKSLDRLVDIVVASPGRLMQHKEQGNVYLSQVTHVIIDEVDTMLTQGFGSDIRAILRGVLKKRSDNSTSTSTIEIEMKEEKSVQLVMASATLTKAVRALLDDVGGFNVEYSDPNNKTPRKPNITDSRVHMSIVEVDGVHRSLPNVQHNVEETKGQDKISVLVDVLRRYEVKSSRTLIFCNTVDSCRAVEYALNEGDIRCICYHGDLNSKEREANLQTFRNGTENYLVCTDIAARGLDINEVSHVVMFDFPLNPVDYLHRAGRTGRAGKKGIVTALVTKRDKVLSDAIQGAVARGMPLDALSSSKRDYQDRGDLASVVGRIEREPGTKRPRPPIRTTTSGLLRKSRTGGRTVGGRGESGRGGRAGARSSGGSSGSSYSSSSSSSTDTTRSRSAPATSRYDSSYSTGGGGGAAGRSSSVPRTTSSSSSGSSSFKRMGGGGGGRQSRPDTDSDERSTSTSFTKTDRGDPKYGRKANEPGGRRARPVGGRTFESGSSGGGRSSGGRSGSGGGGRSSGGGGSFGPSPFARSSGGRSSGGGGRGSGGRSSGGRGGRGGGRT